MTPSRSRRRRPRPRTRPHTSKYSETFNGKMDGRPKFAVFISDVPSIGHLPIATRFLGALSKSDVYPVYFYSILELLKDKRNVDKIQLMATTSKQNGNKPREVTGMTLAKGSNFLVRHLFERAIRSTPELIVIDYLSETIVDAGRLSSVTRKLGYNVIFLKSSFYEDAQRAIDNAVRLITTSIKYQNHAEIWCQREADKWWHEMEKIYLPNGIIGVNRPQPGANLELLDNSAPGDVDAMGTTCSTITAELSSRAREYLQRLEDVARLLDDDNISSSGWTGNNPSGNEPNHVHCQADTTLIVVHDNHLPQGGGRPRLFECLMGKLLQEQGLQFHVIPVGELVVMERFQSLLQWFCKRSDMDMKDTYSYLFLDAFNTLYRDEKIVVLDNIHEGIVMSSYYISRAIDKDWEVIILTRDECWPPADKKTVQQVISHLKQKYFSTHEEDSRTALQGRNHAVGDYLRHE